MKKTHLIVLVMSVVLVVGYSLDAEASAILNLTDTGTGATLTCNTALAMSPTNCFVGAGFLFASGNQILLFNGTVGGFTIGTANLGGNNPGSNTAGQVTLTENDIFHTSGTGNLMVDFGVNDFTLPVGPGLFLGGRDTGSWGFSQATDQKTLQVWGRATNDIIIPGGTATAIVPPCLAGSAGLNRTCSEDINDIPFTRGAGNYALTGRQVITQSAADGIAASYTAGITANAQQVNPVPEPASILTLGIGSILLLVNRRMGRKYGRR